MRYSMDATSCTLYGRRVDMKKYRFLFSKSWFIFPLAIEVNTNCIEYYPPAKSLCVHFLWWHFRWMFFKKGE